MAKTTYDQSFYQSQQDGSLRSARKIIPLILNIIQPSSVLDIGCGVGTWLHTFKELTPGTRVLGVDGDYVDKTMLRIASEAFTSHDLKTYFPAPGRFDLALSVEVGEHLPHSSADALVRSLTDAADVVVFSAALPGQIGTYHINEQYPEYWASKFIERGFVPIDYFRKQIWYDGNIEWWYRQNILLYIKKEVYEAEYKGKLGSYAAHTDPEFLTRIHPDMLQYFQQKYFSLLTVSGFVRHKLYPFKKWLKGS